MFHRTFRYERTFDRIIKKRREGKKLLEDEEIWISGERKWWNENSFHHRAFHLNSQNSRLIDFKSLEISLVEKSGHPLPFIVGCKLGGRIRGTWAREKERSRAFHKERERKRWKDPGGKGVEKNRTANCSLLALLRVGHGFSRLFYRILSIIFLVITLDIRDCSKRKTFPHYG